MKIIVKLQGGVVESVYTDSEESITVEVWDCDFSAYATEEERKEIKENNTRMHIAARSMKVIY